MKKIITVALLISLTCASYGQSFETLTPETLTVAVTTDSPSSEYDPQLWIRRYVQEFAKQGGGHHTLHTHWNGHMSGFYFLKASEKTSVPMFEDPRPGNIMNLLPEKDKTKVTYASSQIHYKVLPGRMIFFPSWLPHGVDINMNTDKGEKNWRISVSYNFIQV